MLAALAAAMSTAATMGVRQLMHSTLPVACCVVDGRIRVQRS